MKYIGIKPLDTLYFGGTQPLEASGNMSVSLFPPTPRTLEGALRTAFLKNQGVSIEDYRTGKKNEVESIIGAYGSTSPIKICGIYFDIGDRRYCPAPVNWYLLSIDKQLCGEICSTENKESKYDLLGIQTSAKNAQFISAEAGKNFIPLSGKWVALDFLNKNTKKAELGDIVSPMDLYGFEPRTGIAVDKGKGTVKEGKIYSAYHVRFKANVTMIISLSKDLPLSEEGVFHLGGETKLCAYREAEVNPYLKDSDFFVSVVPLEVNEEAEKHLVATGKKTFVGGWDYSKQFYKESKEYFPAGTVFDCNIEESCIPCGNCK